VGSTGNYATNNSGDDVLRILIAVGHGGIYSGGAHQALYQLRGFKKRGFDVMAVWGPDIDGDPHGLDRLKELDVPYEIIPIHNTLNLETLSKFRRILKSFKPDIVECFKNGAQYHALYGGLGLNKHAVVFYRGISQAMDVWQGFKYRISRVDRVIANCEDLKWIMAKTGSISADKIDFVHGEYDPRFGDPDKVDASGFRRELSIPEDVRLITQLGNWSEWRGQDVTLKAATNLKRTGYRFHLLFAGRETDKLKPLAAELGISDIVTLSSYRRDPERVIKATDIAVNASTSHESLPGSLINIQTMGVPAVASSVPGASMIVQDNKTGFMTPPQDVAALTEALTKLLDMSDERLTQMGQTARNRAVNLFSSEVRTEKRLKVYEKAIRHRKGL